MVLDLEPGLVNMHLVGLVVHPFFSTQSLGAFPMADAPEVVEHMDVRGASAEGVSEER